MAQSYIPAGTDVIYAEMTGGKPAQLGLTREAKVLYGKERRPLLNACGKKLDCSLRRRIKQSFFLGLAGLLTGLVPGTLTMTLVVITTGVATPIIIATVGATIVLTTSTAAITGVPATYRYLASKCDNSLEGEQSLFHRKVYLEKDNTLLEHSILTCSKGGVVSLVMDHAKAVELVKMISRTNDKVAGKNMWSKFFQGVIGNGTDALFGGFEGQTGGAIVGLILGSSSSVYDYLKGDNSSYRDDNVVLQNEYAKLALGTDDDEVSINTKHDILIDDDMKNSGTDATVETGYSGTGTIMDIIAGNKQLDKEAMSFNERALEHMLKGDMAGAGHAVWASDLAYGARKGVDNIPHEFWKGIWSGKTRTFKWNVSNKWLTPGDIGICILSSIVSNQIEWGNSEEENLLYRSMTDRVEKARRDNKTKTSILANSL